MRSYLRPISFLFCYNEYIDAATAVTCLFYGHRLNTNDLKELLHYGVANAA